MAPKREGLIIGLGACGAQTKMAELQEEYVGATGGTYCRIRRLWHPDEKGAEFQEEYAEV